MTYLFLLWEFESVFSRQTLQFLRMPLRRGGAPIWAGPLDRQHPHQLFRAQGGKCCPTSLGFSAPGPPDFNRY